MVIIRRLLLMLLLLAPLIATATPVAPAAPASEPVIFHLRIEGVINPIKARYVANALAEAKAENARLIIITVNTPGGLVESMEKIIAEMVNSSIPVVTFVAPQAAQATSAGTFIVLAGDVAAMVPGTTIGSAHPVGGQGEKIEGPMEDKVVNAMVSLAKSLAERRNRNVVFAEQSIRSSMNLTAEAAKETNVVDLLARDLPDLMAQLDGYTIDHENRKDTIVTDRCTIRDLPLSRAESFLDILANPSIAYILMTLGVMGLLYEFSSPGVGLGAIVGSISLLLGLLSMSALPIHVGGILLLLLGLIMLILEFKLQTHGLLTTGGIIALVLGSFALVDSGQYYGAVQEVQYGVVLPLVIGIAGVMMFFCYLTLRALRAPQKMGQEGMSGMTGFVKNRIDPEGMVLIDGALWRAVSREGAIEEGEAIQVESSEGNGLVLVVKRFRTPVE